MSQYVDEKARTKSIPLDQYYKSVEIEHIFRQNPQQLHGSNLISLETMMTGRYASAIERYGKNRSTHPTKTYPYAEKKQGYTASEFYLTKSLVQKVQVGVDTKINRAMRTCFN